MSDQEISVGSRPVKKEICELRHTHLDEKLDALRTDFATWTGEHVKDHRAQRDEAKAQGRWFIGLLIPTALGVLGMVVAALQGLL